MNSSIEQLKNRLHEFTNSVDFESNNLEEVLKYVPILEDVLGVEKLNSYTLNLPTENLVLTRARKSEKGKLFRNLEEVSYPEQRFVTKHGRANAFYQPRFYCSDQKGTSLQEVRPLNEWVTSMDVMFTKPELKLLVVVDQNSKYKITGNEMLTNADIAFNEFMAEKFIEEIPEGKDYLYLPTAVLTNLFIPNFDGIVYPSVASKLKGENFAIKTEVIDKYAEVTELRVQESFNHQENGTFKVKCIYRSSKLTSSNQIDWETVNCEGHEIGETMYEKHA